MDVRILLSAVTYCQDLGHDNGETEANLFIDCAELGWTHPPQSFEAGLRRFGFFILIMFVGLISTLRRLCSSSHHV